MAVLEIKRIARSVEVCGHGAHKLCAILGVIGFTGFDAGKLGNGICKLPRQADNSYVEFSGVGL